MSFHITQTKIIVPRRRSDLLSRQRLIDLLYDHLIDQKITIVTAPAGYGKTTLAVDLAHQVDLPICWYALDTLDRNLQRFIAHVIASITYRFPHFGQQSTTALRDVEQTGFDLDRFVTIFVNELYDQVREHFALVLDDYHLVDDSQEISDFINLLAQRTAENCHLLMLSRSLLSLKDLPLMIARAEVGGLDHSELAFQPEEIQALVLQNYHLSLPEQEASELAQVSEGWITGLLLSSQTMWQGMSNQVRAARLSGIGVYTYLAQQVLDQQPQGVREFLLRTSLLGEFDADLCREVWGEEQDWNQLIRLLLRDNLFILRVGPGGNWVRYHHLFRDFLQNQLAQERPGEADEILRQLAAVFARREDWERAREIYQHLGDTEATVKLIEQARASLMRGGRWKTLAEWLDALPIDALNLRPGLVSTRGIVAVMLGEVKHGLALLNQATKALQTTENTYELAYTLERRAYAHLFSGDYQAALSDAEQALSMAKEKEELRVVRAEALKVKAHCLKQFGHVDAALEALKAAIEVFSELGFQDDLALVNSELGEAYRAIGASEHAKSTYQVAIDHFRATSNMVNLALLLNNAGVVYHTTGDYKKSSRYFEEALIYARQSGYKHAEAYTLSSIGDLYAELDAPDAALQAYQEARQLAGSIKNRFLLIYLDLAEAALAYVNGNLSRAGDLLRSARKSSQESNSVYERALILMGAGRLALAEEDAPQAQAHLEEAVQNFEGGSQRVEAARARLYLALAYHTAGELSAGLDQLERAFQSASKLESQHALVVIGREVRPLLEAAQEHPALGHQAREYLRQVTQFEASLPALRRKIRKQISTVPFAPPHLTIRAFGEGQVLLNGKPASSPDWVSRKPVRDLLFCLLAHPHGLTKEEIGVVFWPDCSPSQLKLRFKNTIYWLRHALGQEVILFEENNYRFNRSLDYEYDVETFIRSLDQVKKSLDPGEQIAAYQNALDAYSGPYLPSIDENWAVIEREHLRQLFVQAGLQLAQLWLEAREYPGTLEVCLRLLGDDPCLEAATRLAMRAHAALGDRVGVARQFENCRVSLMEEINVPPSEETRRLHEILMR